MPAHPEAGQSSRSLNSHGSSQKASHTGSAASASKGAADGGGGGAEGGLKLPVAGKSGSRLHEEGFAGKATRFASKEELANVEEQEAEEEGFYFSSETPIPEQIVVDESASSASSSEEDSEDASGNDLEAQEHKHHLMDYSSDDSTETLTTVSNETDSSSNATERPETERQTAMILAPQPWLGLTRPVMKTAAACFLPAMLVLLLLQGLLKLLGFVLQACFDVLYLLFRLLFLALKVCFMPVVLYYRCCVPAFVRHYIATTYEERFGAHVRMVLSWAHDFSEIMGDLPAIASACYLAAVESMARPARAKCWACIFWLFGKKADEWVLTPWHDREINRAAKRRRRPLERAQLADPEVREALKRLAPKRARAKARRHLEAARRARRRKRAEAFEVNLMLPVNDPSLRQGAVAERVQFEENNHSKSRVMRLERRYAVVVGFVWLVIGTYVLTSTLYGTEGERCELCFTRSDLGVKLCRHGKGRACAFELHLREMIIAIGTIAVGGLLSIYAAILYRPLSKAAMVDAAYAAKMALRKRRKTVLRKDEDPELATLQCIMASLERPTIGRRLRSFYRVLPLPSLKAMACCLRCLLRCEVRHRLRRRSIDIQEAVFMAATYTKVILLMVVRREDAEKKEQLVRVLTKMQSQLQMSVTHRMKRRCRSCLRRARGRRASDHDSIEMGAGARQAGQGSPYLDDVLEKFGLKEEIFVKPTFSYTSGSQKTRASRRQSVTSEEPMDIKTSISMLPPPRAISPDKPADQEEEEGDNSRFLELRRQLMGEGGDEAAVEGKTKEELEREMLHHREEFLAEVAKHVKDAEEHEHEEAEKRSEGSVSEGISSGAESGKEGAK